jgi:hypothetical protein
VLPYGAAAVLCLAIAFATIVMVSRRLPGRERTAAAFAWSATLLLLCVPVVHSWYWLTPLALSLAAGLRPPVFLGLGWPAAEAAWLSWPAYRGWAHLVSYAPGLAALRSRAPARGRLRPPRVTPRQRAAPGAALPIAVPGEEQPEGPEVY